MIPPVLSKLCLSSPVDSTQFLSSKSLFMGVTSLSLGSYFQCCLLKLLKFYTSIPTVVETSWLFTHMFSSEHRSRSPVLAMKCDHVTKLFPMGYGQGTTTMETFSHMVLHALFLFQLTRREMTMRATL